MFFIPDMTGDPDDTLLQAFAGAGRAHRFCEDDENLFMWAIEECLMLY